MTDFSQKIPFDSFKKNLMEGPFAQKNVSKLNKTDQKIVNAFNRFGVSTIKLMGSKELKQTLFDSLTFKINEKTFFKRLVQLQQAGRLKKFPS